MFAHSHKKRKDSLEIGTVCIEICVILKFNERPKTPGIIFKKVSLSFPAGDLHAALVKIKIDMLQILKKWNWK